MCRWQLHRSLSGSHRNPRRRGFLSPPSPSAAAWAQTATPRLDNWSGNFIGLSAKFAPATPFLCACAFGSSDTRTKLASSSSTHSLWVVSMTRMPARTTRRELADEFYLHRWVEVRLRFFDYQHIAGLDKVA